MIKCFWRHQVDCSIAIAPICHNFTSQSSIETSGAIELILTWRLHYTYPTCTSVYSYISTMLVHGQATEEQLRLSESQRCLQFCTTQSICSTCLWRGWLLKISISRIQDGRQPPSWKLKKNRDIAWWWTTGFSSVSAVRHLEFLKQSFLTAGTLEKHVLYRRITLLEIGHTIAEISQFFAFF